MLKVSLFQSWPGISEIFHLISLLIALIASFVFASIFVVYLPSSPSPSSFYSTPWDFHWYSQQEGYRFFLKSLIYNDLHLKICWFSLYWILNKWSVKDLHMLYFNHFLLGWNVWEMVMIIFLRQMESHIWKHCTIMYVLLVYMYLSFYFVIFLICFSTKMSHYVPTTTL